MITKIKYFLISLLNLFILYISRDNKKYFIKYFLLNLLLLENKHQHVNSICYLPKLAPIYFIFKIKTSFLYINYLDI